MPGATSSGVPWRLRGTGAGLTGEGHQLASLVHDRDARRDDDLVRLP